MTLSSGCAPTSVRSSMIQNFEYTIGVLEAYERGARSTIPVTHVRRFVDGVLKLTTQIDDVTILRLAPVDYRRVVAGAFCSAHPDVRLVQDSTVSPIMEH